MNSLISPGVYEQWNLSHPFFAFVSFVLGACFGSFGNVCIWRMPRDESVVVVPSHCPRCEREIAWYMNIPVLSWLALHGRCFFCRAPISVRYPLVETLVGAAFVAGWLKITSSHYGEAGMPLISLGSVWFLIAAALVVSIIDLEHRIIPNEIVLSGLALALILAILAPEGHFLAYHPIEAKHRHLMTFAFWDVLVDSHAALWQGDRLLALTDLALGVVLGGGGLWILAELGNLLFRRKANKDATGVPVWFDSQELCINGERGAWEGWFPRTDSRIEIVGSDSDGAAVTVIASVEQLELNGQIRPYDQLDKTELSTTSWVVPQEAMGLGDVKLIAMLGAFFGPQGVVQILFGACILGAGLALVQAATALVRGERPSNAIAFGVAIMGSTLVYIAVL